MAYDIPDEIKYKEKIVANLDLKQLGYASLFGILAIMTYNSIPVQGDFRLILPGVLTLIGIGFVFLNLEEKLKDILSYYTNLRKAPYNSKAAQKFFEVKEIKNNLIWLDGGSKIGIFKIQPINLNLFDNSRKRAILINYKNFLNQLTNPIQILVKTVPVDLQNYFEYMNKKRKRNEMLELYADFKKFEEHLLKNKSVKQRNYYVIANYRPDQKLEEVNNQLIILKDNLSNCGLLCSRLEDSDLEDFLISYGGEDITEGKPETEDEFRNIVTPSFEFYQNYANVNGEYHRVVKVTGYPRKVEDGWLQSFLCKNEDYDISIHINPSSISYNLIYLHNQIIQQTSDLIMSTSKGTPNPSLEIKKNDTMRVYESLYKGEEKMFSVSIYIDNKASTKKELDLLTEKCKSNLNAQLMIPSLIDWRTADSIKSTLPLAKDKINANREILTGALTASFPFISSADSNQNGILFAHELETLNPIFLDLQNQNNKHFFIIGVSGSGKSYAAKYLAVQQLFKDDSRLYILDPNGEYSNISKSLGGDVIEISKDSDTILNLFDLSGDDFGGKMLQLISAFDIIMGGLNESQKALLSDALSNLYLRKGIKPDKEETWNKIPPRFSDLKIVLKEMLEEVHPMSPQAKSLDALYRRVKMYCSGSVFGFLDNNTALKSNNQIICFDLSRLPHAIKPLMIFMILGFIQKQIRKDKEPKTVLIDEGWTLLRSKEAENYLLDFVKTSRKFNASIGFITQDVEDLLQSSTGKSILNTASIKILMRQSTSSINLVSNNLKLNEFEENYILTAKNGHGLIITDNNAYCFFIQAPPKINALITTNPNEKATIYYNKDEKIELDLSRGIYLQDELSDKQLVELMKNNYEIYTTKINKNDQYTSYVIKVNQNESIEHAFLCQYIISLIPESLYVKTSVTRDPDIEVEFEGKKIFFEIETGKRKMDKDQAQMRFLNKSDGNQIYIVVPNERIARRYYPLSQNVITKSRLKDFINSIFLSHSIKDS